MFLWFLAVVEGRQAEAQGGDQQLPLGRAGRPVVEALQTRQKQAPERVLPRAGPELPGRAGQVPQLQGEKQGGERLPQGGQVRRGGALTFQEQAVDVL